MMLCPPAPVLSVARSIQDLHSNKSSKTLGHLRLQWGSLKLPPSLAACVSPILELPYPCSIVYPQLENTCRAPTSNGLVNSTCTHQCLNATVPQLEWVLT